MEAATTAATSRLNEVVKQNETLTSTTAKVLWATGNNGTKADFITWSLFMISTLAILPSKILTFGLQPMVKTVIMQFYSHAVKQFNERVKPKKRSADDQPARRALLPTREAVEACECPVCRLQLTEADKVLAVNFRPYAISEIFAYLAAYKEWQKSSSLDVSKPSAAGTPEKWRPRWRRVHGHDLLGQEPNQGGEASDFGDADGAAGTKLLLLLRLFLAMTCTACIGTRVKGCWKLACGNKW